MSLATFRCTCRAIFETIEDRDAHCNEEELKRQRLEHDLRRHLEQSLAHSKTEGNERTADPNHGELPDVLAKHKDRNGYHCPRQGCTVFPATKPSGLREHYGTRKKAKQKVAA